ncbi:MAG TPA: prepilin-type N-terminal cleavage/methylation domain-containing protein [Candidatus Paceibacterota bacterium]
MTKSATRVQRKKSGFTLIETLIYIALYSIIVGGAVVAVYAIFESAGRNQAKAMLQEEGMFLVGKLNWTLSGVQTVNIPALGATSSDLSITKFDGSTSIITISSTGTMMTQDGGAPLSLNNTNTEVGELVFSHVGVENTGIFPEGIRVSFILSARTGNGMLITQAFSTTRYLRK